MWLQWGWYWTYLAYECSHMDGLPLCSSIFSVLLLSYPGCGSSALAWRTAELLGPGMLLFNVINIDLINIQGRENRAGSERLRSLTHAPLCAWWVSRIGQVKALCSPLQEPLWGSSAPLNTECFSIHRSIGTIFCTNHCQCLGAPVNKGMATSVLLMPVTACSHRCGMRAGEKQKRGWFKETTQCNCLFPFLSHLFLSDFHDGASGQALALGVILGCL